AALDRLEHDDRNATTRLLRVLVVAGIEISERAPQPLPLLTLRVARAHLLCVASDRDLRERVRLEVQVPERMPAGAALGRDHHVAVVPGSRVQERARPRSATLAPGCREQKHSGFARPPADLP